MQCGHLLCSTRQPIINFLLPRGIARSFYLNLRICTEYTNFTSLRLPTRRHSMREQICPSNKAYKRKLAHRSSLTNKIRQRFFNVGISTVCYAEFSLFHRTTAPELIQNIWVYRKMGCRIDPVTVLRKAARNEERKQTKVPCREEKTAKVRRQARRI